MPDSGILIGNVSLGNFLVFIFIFIVTIAAGNAVYGSLRRFLDTKISKRSSKAAARALQYAVFALGLYHGVYNVLGLDLTALVASLGIIGIAIAFSSQQVIQNIIAGILIAVERPIQLEDWVEIGASGVSRVSDIKLMHTALRDINGRLLHIPNSAVLNSNIVNYTASGFVGINVQLKMPLGSDLEKAKKAILDAANANQKILPNVSKEEKNTIAKLFKLPQNSVFWKKSDLGRYTPQVTLSALESGDMTLTARVWIAEIDKKEQIVGEFLEAARKKMLEEKPLA